jgi:hypothetical protein
MANMSFDPVDSIVRLIHDMAKRIECWQLDDETDSKRGSLNAAASHIRLAAKHFLRANGRKIPGGEEEKPS